MGAIAATTYIAGAAAATTAYAAYNSEDARYKGEDQANRAKGAQITLIEKEKQAQQTQEDSAKAAAARDQARQRQYASAQSSQGFGSTILTSPLGVPATPSASGGKTILGS